MKAFLRGILMLAGVGLPGFPSFALGQLPAPAVSSLHPLHVGGYGSVSVGRSQVAGSSTSIDLTEAAAAVLVSGTLRNRLSYFGELDLASRGSENWTGRQDDHTLEVERLYAEYSFSDAFRVRIGRFLTPVGQWNERHAEPLTWTVLRPLTTYRPFAKSSTGGLVAGDVAVGGREMGYAAYVAVPSLARAGSEESEFLHAAGGRIALETSPGTYVGVSGVAFRGSRPLETEGFGSPGPGRVQDGEMELAREREEDNKERVLFGLDFLADVSGVQLSGEGVWLAGSGEQRAQRGAFVQGAIPVLGDLFGVLRIEGYDPVDAGSLWTYTLGATWRPHPRIVLKLDRQITARSSARVPDGWFFSISSLF